MRRALLMALVVAVSLTPTAAEAARDWTVVPTPTKGTTFDNFSAGTRQVAFVGFQRSSDRYETRVVQGC